jgi:NADPH:quinone reductase-like Zn-dependent oxidoreductase
MTEFCSGYKLMKYLPNFVARRPIIAESDFAGTVVKSTAPEFKPGDQVFGWIPPVSTSASQGALCEYTRAPATHLVHRPSTITPSEAAGVALVSLSGWDAMYRIADIKEGQRIFVNGGSSAVGSWAIMLAKLKGCWVTATASTKNEAYVRRLGADEVHTLRFPLVHHSFPYLI